MTQHKHAVASTANATSGMKAAIKNNPRFRESPHPYDKPYNSRCLLKDCETPVYHDGATYFSLCLLHLEELRLGPFFKPHNDKVDDYDQDDFIY